MKRKHKDAMIAMGIKISALEHLFKMHGQAHMAQDISPQLSQHIKDHQENSRKMEAWMVDWMGRVENLEKRMVQIDIHRDRLNDHDESIEALSETVDQLSTCQIYSEQIKTLVREVETLKIQMGNTILHTNKLMEGFVRQQEINNGVQRDLRIITSPGYAKEIAAQKQDAKSKKAK